MRLLTVLFTCLMINSVCHAQIKAITETGEEVILYDDGTWKYTKKSDQKNKDIKTNPQEFKKSKNSTFLLKSTKLNIGIWLNPKKWKFEKSIQNPDAEYELQLKGEDLYGMVITEKIKIPLLNLKNIAFENGRAAIPDLQIIKQEYRTINGLKVLMLKMEGSLQGINLTYYGYYFSNSNGTVQLLTYTSQDLVKEYFEDIEELLNGFVELE